MSRFRAVFAVAVVSIICIATSAGQSMKDKSQSTDKNGDVIKVGVAVPKNTATRSVPVTMERDRLVNAMERAGWVQAKAARILGLTPRQVGYALKKHDIEVKHF